jgi:hypothetical protein
LRGRISGAQSAGRFDSFFESHRQLTTQIWQSSPLGGITFPAMPSKHPLVP